MKKMISSFGSNVLSREQMKEVVGGIQEDTPPGDEIGCVICSSGPNGGGACGTATFATDTAYAFARDLNGRLDGYSYSVVC